jgi:hypothetical protein
MIAGAVAGNPNVGVTDVVVAILAVKVVVRVPAEGAVRD